MFSTYGVVQKIAIFEKNGQTQALVQYPGISLYIRTQKNSKLFELDVLIDLALEFSDVGTAASAREALEGHCIYDGGYCKLHLSYSRHTDLNVKV